MSGSSRDPGAAAGAELRVRLAPELRMFLPARRRAAGEVRVPYDPTASLGHVVQALGVPLTEVGELRADDREVADAHRPRAGAAVEALPVARPQPVPGGGPPAFLLDVHLGTLARRLRLLGVDTAYRNDADSIADDALVRRADAERHVLLTRDRGLLRRRTPWLAAYVRGASPREQLADVLDRFAPPPAPWTRCPACNGALAPAAKEEVAHLLEPGTRRTYDTFVRCDSCGRPYWRGAYAQRLDGIVSEAHRLISSRPGTEAPCKGGWR